MQNSLKIALIQSELIWENPEKNRLKFYKNIVAIKEDVDLVILPEMFTTGFTMNPYVVAETMQGETIKWLKKLASVKNTAITGSLIINEHNNFYNRLVFVFPSGEIQTYDKRHTFTLAGEHKVYTAGNKKLIVDYSGWKICPLICYDLRFPVWSRNVEGYDLLIYVANWPKPRIGAWDALLKARAIENMSYCIGVNRIGKDENNYEYTGHSAVFNSLGEQISITKPNEMRTEIITLKKESLVKTRDQFQFLKDQDQFTLMH